MVSSRKRSALFVLVSVLGLGVFAPADARANDLFHRQVVLRSDHALEVRSAASATGGRQIGVAARGAEALVRDRDGHALLARSGIAP